MRNDTDTIDKKIGEPPPLRLKTMESTEFENISFDMPKSQSNAIKVIGVGGGGSNAVNYMFQHQTKGVDFVVCNTDAQALENSPVPVKIQLGVSLTSGLGAGANPEIGEEAAIESLEEIKKVLTRQTKMVFITAGMGGGTGTGAAPIIAKLAKDMQILTVGIVTVPFQFEGRMRADQAQKGVDALRQHVDSLIVINNNKLREVYGNLGFKAGFSKADEVLSTASRGIAEVITHHYKQNIDLHDAKTVLSNSGTAIMGSAKESGTNRAKNAIVKALDSPLLNDNKITGAKNVLLLIISGRVEVTLDEIGEINDFIQLEAGHEANIIMGVGEDEALEDALTVTVVATGFASEQQSNIVNTEAKKIIHTLEDEQKAVYDFDEKEALQQRPVETTSKAVSERNFRIVHELGDDDEEAVGPFVKTTPFIENLEVVYEAVQPEALDPEGAQFLEVEDFVIEEVTPEASEQVLDEAPSDEEASVQMDLLFDLPIADSKKASDKAGGAVYFDLEGSTDEFLSNIEVVDAQEVQINAEEDAVKKFVLEDFESLEPTIQKASQLQLSDSDRGDNPQYHPSEPEELEEELNFKVSIEEKTKLEEIEVFDAKELSPLDLTIAELKMRSDKRREKMKKFNYKFANTISKNVDEIEKQPAYKRMGVDLSASENEENIQSRTSVSTDDNNEIQLRSNNSFLHDNVD